MNDRKFNITLLLLTTITFLTVCGFSHQWKEILTVNMIEVTNEHLLSKSQICQIAGIKKGDSYFGISLDSIRLRLLNQDYIKDVHIMRKQNNIIHIDIKERQPVAMICAPKVYFLDEEGVLLSRIKTNEILDLPVITGTKVTDSVLKINRRVNEPEIELALSLLKLIAEIDPDMTYLLSEINMNNGNDIFIYTSDYGIPINIGRGSYSQKIKMLSTFWKNIVNQNGSHKLITIDLRFDEQVVVRWKLNQDKSNSEKFLNEG